MNQDWLVSVIVPVYNVEEYLCRCVESVINQTYINLEILLIDDGSSDRCREICDEYACQDSRIKTFHKKNGGLSDARNFALDRMNGDCVTFVDSDDFVDPQYVQVLVDLLKNSNANISMVEVQTFKDESLFPRHNGVTYAPIVYTKEETLRRALKVQLRQSVCGKLYKKQIFEKIRFPKGMLYEDLAIFDDLIDKSNGIVYASLPLYKYFMRAGSIMHQSFKIQQMDEIIIIDNEMKKLESARPDLNDLIQARKVYSYMLVLNRILSYDDKGKYVSQKEEVKNKIMACKKRVMFNHNVKMSWKIRLLSLSLGDSCFYVVNKFLNHLMQLR